MQDGRLKAGLSKTGEQQLSIHTRKHSSRMRTARLPTYELWWPPLDVSTEGGGRVSRGRVWGVGYVGEDNTLPCDQYHDACEVTYHPPQPHGQNKNEFQWDAYCPLVDRIPACTVQGRCLPRGCLPGGVSAWGVYPSMQWARHSPMDRQTPVKTYLHKLRLRAVMIDRCV